MRQIGFAQDKKLVTYDKLLAETHQYQVYSSEKCKFIPTIPILAIIIRSSTNAQVHSYIFNYSCIIKHAIGKEVWKIPIFNFKDNNNKIKVITSTSANPNTKISSVQIWESSNKNKNKARNKNAMEVSRTELSSILLDFECTYSNVIFSYTNTLPLEYRPSMLKKDNRRGWM